MPSANQKAILAELKRLYPDAKPELNFSNPYETLVATILSAQCTDKQVNKVTPAVFARYPDVASMAAASVEDLYPMVKSCGFKSKAGHIIDACRMIVAQYGGEVPSTLDELVKLSWRWQKDCQRSACLCLQYSCLAGGYPRFPCQQSAGLGGCFHSRRNRTAADASDTKERLAGGASLADFSRKTGLQGTAPYVRGLHIA